MTRQTMALPQPLNKMLSGCLLTLLLLTGCMDDQVSEQAFRSTLVFCSEASPSTFDPHTVTAGTAFDASARQLYNRLVAFKPGTLEVVPSLARSWTTNRRGTRYVFNLRNDVNFHTTDYFTPTRRFNADDVIFSFERQSDPTNPYHFVGRRKFLYFNSQGLNSLITAINKIDDYTVEFLLSEPSSPFLSILAMEFTSILSAEYAEKLLANQQSEQLLSKPIGTGPFVLKRYQADAFIRYQAHAKYFKGPQSFDNLVFAITPDASLRFARLTAGECDVMKNPLPLQIEALSELDAHLEVIQEPGLNVSYWAFNTRKPPFDNPLVRQAMNYAIDRQSIIKAVYFNAAEIAKTPIPPNMWSHAADIKDYEYSPEKAKQLLEQAGLPNGFATTIWVFPEQRSYNPNAPKTAELIQQNLKAIGVDAKIISYEVGTFLQRVRDGEHDTSVQGWVADNGDPDNFLNTLLSCKATVPGQNVAFWCDQEFDAIVKDAHSITSRPQRTRLYQKAQRIFKEQAPWLTLAHSKQFMIINERVKNLSLSPTGGVFFENVTLVDSQPSQATD